MDSWTNEEIARQWLKVFPRKDDEGRPLPPDKREVRSLAYSRNRMKELRLRLSSVSWFMRCLNENIARRANREDNCKGRFWEGRFKCQALLDDSAVLACMAYVDLNPIRAGIAETPEESLYTSIHNRITARQMRDDQPSSPTPTENPADKKAQQKKKLPLPDAWLCPIGKGSPSGRHGILDMTLDEYIDLVDWTGRKLLENKRGAIPAHLCPILLRLNVEEKRWLNTVRDFGRMFHRAAGRMESMIATAQKTGQRWLRGFRIAGKAFSINPG